MFSRIARVVVLPLVLVGVAVGVAACGGDDGAARDAAPATDAATEVDTSPVETVDVDAAFAAAEQDEVLLVDVRLQEEWDAGHAAEAIHVPLADVEDRLDEIADEAAGRPVWFICRSGNRSEQAARTARAGGLNEVVSVDGGMGAWVEAGHPIEPIDGAVV